MSLKIKVLKCAAVSRLLLFVLQVFFNAVIVDHHADAFLKSVPSKSNEVEHAMEFLLEGFSRWDAQYFLNVAEHGYVYEKMLAFFPLFPLLVRVVANTVYFPLQIVVNYHLVLLLASVTLNFIFFTLAALLLYLLCCELLADEYWAYRITLLFCYNPASVFFSAAYSEALFSCTVFAGILLLEKEFNLGATAAFAASALVRSNGTINAGFLLYAGAVLPIVIHRLRGGSFRWTLCCYNTIISVFQSLVVVATFALYQFFAYETFCVSPRPLQASLSGGRQLEISEFVLPGEDTPWCQATIPVSYGYVQSRYWNVGFFRYFETKQIPNFLLACPAVVLCLHGIFCYALSLLKALNKNTTGEIEKHLRILPYIVHCSFLLAFGITSMHVQVVTRLLASSSPFFCLFAAASLPELPIIKKTTNNHNRKPQKKMLHLREVIVDYVPLVLYWSRRKHLKRRSKLVLIYFVSYFVIGTACFSNFLPWT